MNQPFFAAANRVLCMYTLRQERISSRVQAHSAAEISWACEKLNDIAGAAAYAASKEAITIITAAELWGKTGRMPDLFDESVEVSPS